MKDEMALKLGNISVNVVRKNIKHIHLKIIPPTHEVRISVPRQMPIEVAQALAMSKYDWLASRLETLRAQEQTLATAAQVGRETCLVWGKRYPLEFIECDAAPTVELTEDALRVYVYPNTSVEKRNAILERWYRAELGKALSPFIAKWEQIMGVSIGRISLQRMKTRWGTCNSATRTIRMNVELVKKPREQLEYVLVHEMTHFQHNNHGAGFQAAMDHAMPTWRTLRRELDIFPRI